MTLLTLTTVWFGCIWLCKSHFSVSLKWWIFAVKHIFGTFASLSAPGSWCIAHKLYTPYIWDSCRSSLSFVCLCIKRLNTFLFDWGYCTLISKSHCVSCLRGVPFLSNAINNFGNIRSEILAALKLQLTSMGPGFHPWTLFFQHDMRFWRVEYWHICIR